METTNFLQFLTSPNFSGWLLILKILFIIFLILLLIFIIFSLARTSWLERLFFWDLKEFLTYRPYYGVRKIYKTWERIVKRLETGPESEYKLAVIEADSLLNDILIKMGYGGETLGERLKQLTPAIVPNLEKVWEAHKIRNNIVHDPDYRLSLDEARKVLAIYETALRDLQVF